MTTENRRQGPAAGEALRAWQDGITAMLTGYNRQASQLSAGVWGMRIDPGDVRSSVRRIAEETREVTNAQIGVASEWLRVPFWFTGAASPSSLQDSYGRLMQAYNRLFTAYMEAARPVREATERAVDTASKVAEEQVETGREVAREVNKANAATASAAVEATTNGATRIGRNAADAVDQAIEVAEKATNRAASQATATAVPAQVIKGHVSSSGEKIYHLPGQSSYERTQADETFATEEEAQRAGYRRAETPGGGKIKGKISREGEKIYHVPGQANYDRFDADMLFESEEAALAAGFRPAQR
jgi:hypothetical protein